MKLRVDRAELAEALGITNSVTPTRTPKPILQCVLVEAHSDYVLLSATDLEIGVRVSVTQVQVEKKGAALLPADKLGQIVRETTDEVVHLEVTDNTCHLRGSDSHFQVYVQDPKDFPPVTVGEGPGDFELAVGELHRLAEWTLHAAARENTRYAITGVLWDWRQEKLTLVATDGRRMSRAAHHLKGTDGNRSAIVPIKTMQLVTRVLGEATTRVTVTLAPNQIVLKTPRVTISSSLLEGHFPDYEKVVPDDCDKRVELDTREFLSAVRRAALLTNEESKGIKLSFSRGKLTFSSRAPEQGEATVAMNAAYDGPELDIGFNPVFLIDVLRVVNTDKVLLEFRQAHRPGVFRCGDDFLYVVMPVSL